MYMCVVKKCLFLLLLSGSPLAVRLLVDRDDLLHETVAHDIASLEVYPPDALDRVEEPISLTQS